MSDPNPHAPPRPAPPDDALDRALRALPARPAPEATIRRTLERVAAERDRRATAPWGWALLSAASLLAVAGAWVGLRPASSPQGPAAEDAVARLEPGRAAARGRYALRRAASSPPAGPAGDAVSGLLLDGEAPPERSALTNGLAPADASALAQPIDGRFGAAAGDFAPLVDPNADGYFERTSDLGIVAGTAPEESERGRDGLVAERPDAKPTDLPWASTAATAPSHGDGWADAADGQGTAPFTQPAADKAQEVTTLRVLPGAYKATLASPAGDDLGGDETVERGLRTRDAEHGSNRGTRWGFDTSGLVDAQRGGQEAPDRDRDGVVDGKDRLAPATPAEGEATGEALGRGEAVGRPAITVGTGAPQGATGSTSTLALVPPAAGPAPATTPRGPTLPAAGEDLAEADQRRPDPKSAADVAKVEAAGAFEALTAEQKSAETTRAPAAREDARNARGTEEVPAQGAAGGDNQPLDATSAFWSFRRAALGSRASGALGGLPADANEPPPAAPAPARVDPPKVAKAAQAAPAPRVAPRRHADAPPRLLVPPADATQGLTFLAPRGYFANTYHPGDPERAWLAAALHDRLERDGAPLSLERRARPPVQPFAAPAGRGLGLALSADRATATPAGPVRLTVQLGLAGADALATRRAPLALALVLDLAGAASEADRQALWGLADALASSREPGDRFTVVLTGAAPGAPPTALSGDTLAGPSLRRALAAAWEAKAPAAPGDLPAALAAAVGAVRAAAPADAPLGAELVVLASPRPLGAADAAPLAAAAHAAALAGVQVSTVSAGPAADPRALTAVADAGHGRRLLARSAPMARDALAGELAATGRAVARAVRLRIRLAPGVRLVGVLGSAPLDAPAADRVRAAERAIDAQVRAATGIAADRGADEDGLQIVVPAFYAGDRHVILLDLVAAGPGPLLDVRARFKDLVALDNGEAAASLALDPAGAAASATPAARNVAANRARFALGEALLEASDALGRGERDAAARTLASAARGLEQLVAGDAALASALGGDAALLAEYLGLLDDAEAWGEDPELAAWVGRSLRLAGLTSGARR